MSSNVFVEPGKLIKRLEEILETNQDNFDALKARIRAQFLNTTTGYLWWIRKLTEGEIDKKVQDTLRYDWASDVYHITKYKAKRLKTAAETSDAFVSLTIDDSNWVFTY